MEVHQSKQTWIREGWGQEIFQAFRMAMHPRKMIIAFMTVALICGIGWIMDFSRSVVVSADGQITELDVYVQNTEHIRQFRLLNSESTHRAGVFTTLFTFASDRFHTTVYSWFRIEQIQTVAIPETVRMLRDAVTCLSWVFSFHLIYSILFFALTSLVLAIGGGAISRMVALQLALDERPGLVESLRFSVARVSNFMAALWIPLIIVAVIGISITLLGLVGNIPWVGELAVALSMPVMLLAGVIMVFFFVGVAAGWGLLSPAIAYEDSESFTAINNAFRYVYAQPWLLGLYGFLAGIYGAVTYIFVRFFAFATLLVTYRSLQLGFLGENDKLTAMWVEPSFVDMVGGFSEPSAVWTVSLSGFLIYLCVLIVAGVVGSYIVSFYYSVSTIIYALMRFHVDQVPIQQINTRVEIQESN